MKPIGLHDIRGLDHLSFWPLALGWWIVIGVVALAVVGVTFYFVRRRRIARSWQTSVRAQLESLRIGLKEETSRDAAVELSELLRRLAFSQGHRTECANLHGEAWLGWLKSHDKNGFDWMSAGQPLVTAPYAPPGTVYDPENLGQTIEAAKGWIL